MTDEILFDRQAEWGVITLNRPKALNALSIDMCAALDNQLRQWQEDDTIHAVLIKGAGDRAFCAGGDIRWLATMAAQDPVKAAEFFRVEYTMNALIAHFPKPYVAMLDGVTMGGGVGVSAFASHRIVSDKTLWAMPETAIGLFPDVGGTYFLSRLKSGLGYYAALTGARLTAADLLYAELSDVNLGARDGTEIEAGLLALTAPTAQSITAYLSEFNVKTDSELQKNADEIATYFENIDTIESLMQQLSSAKTEFAAVTYKTLSHVSATSMKITLEAMKRARTMTIDETLIMEFGIASRLMAGHDFAEGVRAQIIEKTRDPKWAPAKAEDIPETDILAYFEDMGAAKLVLK
ncbi:MAG: enoyl-CoA hydratase/isomerase family protein [bacterium]